MTAAPQAGRIIRIAGAAVVANHMESARLNDIVHVGDAQLLGEVIRIDRDQAFLQVFEDTTGLRLGEPVENTGAPLSVALGPGLLGQVFDGIQRPLPVLREERGAFLPRGVRADALDAHRTWAFDARVNTGDAIAPGDILGVVMEQERREHRVMAPPGITGEIAVVRRGRFTVWDPVVELTDGRTVSMAQNWPVKLPRPSRKKLDLDEPFTTGQRVLDTLFPLCLGGSAILPGGFGTGKTVLEQTLAKCANCDIIVYVGCGERGNEMTDVLTEFPELQDPHSGRPLMERTILVANTSNMPVAAREASVYVGLTMAEYYRDMGYHVALLADSTSRWAEAMREISSRLEEMPGEEGYPTYLASRLAGFYERSGKVDCLGAPQRRGSVTIVGAVSPPGGDYSEPVTQNSQRLTGAVWALDATLAYRRHFPSVNWQRGYSLYPAQLEAWYNKEVGTDWMDMVHMVQGLLQQDAELQEVVQLVGPDGLQNTQRVVLETGRAIREDFLQQNAFSDVDMRCSLAKQKAMLEAILFYYEQAREAVTREADVEQLVSLPQRELLSRMKDVPEPEIEAYLETFKNSLREALHELAP